MTDRVICTSHAKINWWLRVGDVRPDGYHELETVYQELELGETIMFHRNDSDVINLFGYPPDIKPEQNLVTKSWELMRSHFWGKVGGVDITVVKTLPRGGGLGGGSSNAACTLAALNNLFGLGASQEDLQRIGAEIGSDVPFFIQGGTAIGRGRGEVIEQLRPSPRYWLVLLFPEESMSTAEAYRILDTLHDADSGDGSHKLSAFLTKLYAGNPLEIAEYLTNDFELVAERYEWYRKAREKLLGAGALKTFLCGSGSTVAGIVTDESSGQRVADIVGGILTSTRHTA